MSFEPTFLRVDQVKRLHDRAILRYGGDPGIRDDERLASAVAMPYATFDGAFLHGDMCEMAAAYAYYIAEGQPFLDGNKRTGAAAALAFLDLNNISLPKEEANHFLYIGLIDVGRRVDDRPVMSRADFVDVVTWLCGHYNVQF